MNCLKVMKNLFFIIKDLNEKYFIYLASYWPLSDCQSRIPSHRMCRREQLLQELLILQKSSSIQRRDFLTLKT